MTRFTLFQLARAVAIAILARPSVSVCVVIRSQRRPCTQSKASCKTASAFDNCAHIKFCRGTTSNSAQAVCRRWKHDFHEFHENPITSPPGLSLSILAPCCLAAAGISYQPAALVPADLQPYAGTWHWMFKGKLFVTIQLIAAGDHFTGYMTNGHFDFDRECNMTDAGSDPGRSPILRTFFSGKTLHIVAQGVQDKSLVEWTMNIVDSKTAEFNINVADPDAPKNSKSWTAERTSN